MECSHRRHRVKIQAAKTRRFDITPLLCQSCQRFQTVRAQAEVIDTDPGQARNQRFKRPQVRCINVQFNMPVEMLMYQPRRGFQSADVCRRTPEQIEAERTYARLMQAT